MRIVFYAAQSGKPWTGDTLETEALGGSETAVISMAKALSDLGHEVLVFARGKPGFYDGVLYIAHERARTLLRTLPCDILVCARDPLPLLWQHRASVTVNWLHDVPINQLPDSTFIFCVSRWQAAVGVQRGLFKPERVKITPNGIDPSLFMWQHEVREFSHNDPVSLVWTSNPERGLWYAEQALRKVQAQYPNAYLSVYGRSGVYGWASSYERNFFPDNLDDVVIRDPVTKRELAQVLTLEDLWVYPTWWPETYCIAGLEAQAAGLPVVASAFAGLDETLPSLGKVVGPVTEPDHLDRFANRILHLLGHPDERRQLQEQGLAFAQTQTWPEHAKNWSDMLLYTLGSKAA